MLGEDTPVINAIRKYNHVCSESVAADVGALPRSSFCEFVEGGPDGKAEFCAALIVTTVRAHGEHQFVERFASALQSA
jgi:hypothetical protein